MLKVIFGGPPSHSCLLTVATFCCQDERGLRMRPMQLRVTLVTDCERFTAVDMYSIAVKIELMWKVMEIQSFSHSHRKYPVRLARSSLVNRPGSRDYGHLFENSFTRWDQAPRSSRPISRRLSGLIFYHLLNTFSCTLSFDHFVLRPTLRSAIA